MLPRTCGLYLTLAFSDLKTHFFQNISCPSVETGFHSLVEFDHRLFDPFPIFRTVHVVSIDDEIFLLLGLALAVQRLTQLLLA
jgi:hypothetical protein